MIGKNINSLLSDISLALFRKNFFGVYHGSISAKLDQDTFLINKKDAIFDEIDDDSLCKLKMNSSDYGWDEASIESNVHNTIYNLIHEAKFIACGMPPYTTAYTLNHDVIEFDDYFGKQVLGTIKVYDPGDFKTWYGRNSLEITKYLKETNNQIMVIRGIGVYVYDRDINELIKKVSILENSCRILGLKKAMDSYE
jgi:L-fuculose-phosphate aldolase